MTESSYQYAPIHYLDRTTVGPLCARVDTRCWSWTLAASTVTCPRCRSLLERLAAPRDVRLAGATT